MLRFSDARLRSIDKSDRTILLQWRNSERVHANMYTDHLIEREEHDAWFDRALVTSNSRYFIFEYRTQPAGFVSFTNVDDRNERCSWAFYLGETDLPSATGAAVEFLALAYAFDEMAIRKLCCEVLAFNRGVIRMHKKFGFCEEGIASKHVLKCGAFQDVVLLALFRDDWLVRKQSLYERCFGSAGA